MIRIRLLLTIAGILFFVANSLICAAESPAERLENSPRHLEWVKVSNGDRQVNCFLAYPEVADKAHAVIVIHEIFGLTDWVRGVADQLAEAGYIAIAPDLLSGMGPDGGGSEAFGSGDRVRRAIAGLPADQVTADLNAVAEYVSKLPAADGTVSVCGFCWGGSQTFRCATNNKNLKAAFVFYGTGPNSAEDIARIDCPVYGFYGGNDNRVGATIPRSKELMEAAGKTYQPVTYDGAGHGFMRQGESPDGREADVSARNEAWQRWKQLLSEIQ